MFVLIVEFYFWTVVSRVQSDRDVLEKIWCCRILTKPFHGSSVSLTPNEVVFFLVNGISEYWSRRKGTRVHMFTFPGLSPPPHAQPLKNLKN